ncbi:MAG: hypothetical protein AB7R55_20770 [Gemmatimonadales bacterium]
MGRRRGATAQATTALWGFRVKRDLRGQLEVAAQSGSEAVALAEQLQDWSMVALALGGLAETTAWIDRPAIPRPCSRGRPRARSGRATSSARRKRSGSGRSSPSKRRP